MFNKKPEDSIKIIRPQSKGWIEKKLDQDEMDFLWKCIEKRGRSFKANLAGNIYESYGLTDKNDWFFTHTVGPLIQRYEKEFGDQVSRMPYRIRHPFYLNGFWVNYQRQNEFNPLHDHTGVYSFVIWLKLPVEFADQNRNPISSHSNTRNISAFQFLYLDMLGGHETYLYELGKAWEGTMLFFPSKLNHQVYPFLNCEEERISISGNILLNGFKKGLGM